MTASTVWLNGVRLGEYRGGFTPFGFDLAPHVDHEGENVVVVEVDSTERPDIPPFGHLVDYLTFGGIYREVSLKLVASSFLENVFARPMNVMSDRPELEVDCSIQHLEAGWADFLPVPDPAPGEPGSAPGPGPPEALPRPAPPSQLPDND